MAIQASINRWSFDVQRIWQHSRHSIRPLPLPPVADLPRLARGREGTAKSHGSVYAQRGRHGCFLLSCQLSHLSRRIRPRHPPRQLGAVSVNVKPRRPRQDDRQPTLAGASSAASTPAGLAVNPFLLLPKRPKKGYSPPFWGKTRPVTPGLPAPSIPVRSK